MKIAALTKNYERIRGELVDRNIDLKRELSKMEEDLHFVTESAHLEEEQLAKALESEFSTKVNALEREQAAIVQDKENAFSELKRLRSEINVSQSKKNDK